MKFIFLPKTKAGKYCVALIALTIISVLIVGAVGMNAEPTNNSGGFFGNMPLALMTIGAFAAAIVSFSFGLIAIVRNTERSVLVYICLAIGALAIYFGIAQVIGEIYGEY